jgi:hypothetical protein
MFGHKPALSEVDRPSMFARKSALNRPHHRHWFLIDFTDKVIEPLLLALVCHPCDQMPWPIAKMVKPNGDGFGSFKPAKSGNGRQAHKWSSVPNGPVSTAYVDYLHPIGEGRHSCRTSCDLWVYYVTNRFPFLKKNLCCRYGEERVEVGFGRMTPHGSRIDL